MVSNMTFKHVGAVFQNSGGRYGVGWPIIVIKGTGGVADRIRDALEEPAKFITDAALTEVIQEGMIEFVELSEVDGLLTQAMIRRLFNAQLERLANQKARELLRQQAVDAQLAKRKSFRSPSFRVPSRDGSSKTALSKSGALDDAEGGGGGGFGGGKNGSGGKEGYEMSAVVPYNTGPPPFGRAHSLFTPPPQLRALTFLFYGPPPMKSTRFPSVKP